MNDCSQPENAITRVVKKEVKKKVRKLRGRSDSDTDDDEFEDDLVSHGKGDLLFSRSEILRCRNGGFGSRETVGKANRLSLLKFL